jgi:hypothetical protein
MKPSFTTQLTLSAFALLLAIAPVPFEKWSWQRIGFGILGLAGFVSVKPRIDTELAEQRLLDVSDFNDEQHFKALAEVEKMHALEAARQQEAVRFGLQTKVVTADYQGAFVSLMEEKHPYYLDALQAQQEAALEAQRQGGYSGSSTGDRFGEVIEVGAIGSETPSSFVEPQDRGQRLLQRLRKSDMSILVVGSTGAGKSHTLSAYLEFLYQDSPDADVWVISRKNDSFCGLREAGRVVRFNSLDPVDALDKLREIHVIFQERTEVLEEDRPKLSTIRLILEDWSSICLILKKNKVIWNEVQIILSDIVTVGRELNIALFILAQSAILESLGLVGDANLRTCLAIVAQGLESINNKGEKQGDYNLIQLILKNAYIIPSDEHRKLLTDELSELITKSRQTKQPVFLCTGGEAFVGLLPRITKATLPVNQQSSRVVQNNSIAPAKQDNIPHIDTQRQQLDKAYNQFNLADYLRNEATQEELDALIQSWRSSGDTHIPEAFDTQIQKNASDTQTPEYQNAEPLPSNESPRILTDEDFAKYLPGHSDLQLYSKAIDYLDISQNASDIIKNAWKFTSGSKYKLGRSCFVFVMEKYGTPRQKKLFSTFIDKYGNFGKYDDDISDETDNE